MTGILSNGTMQFQELYPILLISKCSRYCHICSKRNPSPNKQVKVPIIVIIAGNYT